ncbi:MAG: hypothetical protein KDC34_13850 [Saprospiraceae bacterium]|nr:hypothetical protein [Saprospiraceae bacterium]
MKNLKSFTLLVLAALFMAVPNANAVVALESSAVATEAVVTAPTLTKQQERELAKMEKQMARMEKQLAKRGQTMNDVDFGDPVKKWMWFWIFGWAAGLLLYIIAAVALTGSFTGGGFGLWGILTLLGGLCWLFGSVSLIVWLIKMFA